MVAASGAAMWPHRYWVPAVPSAVSRKEVGEASFWLKATQDQDKGRGISLLCLELP